MKIAMTLKVRDEADIILDNLRFHAAQGVSLFIVADHGSTDGTRELLAPYVEAGLVHLVEAEGDDVIDLALRNMTRLIDLARELGADWVIHNDADEFWWPVAGDLGDAFAMVEDDYGLVIAPRAELPPIAGDGPWPERMIYRDARSLHRPKVAHRTLPGVRMHGSHPSTIWVEGGEATRGTMKLRSSADAEPRQPDLGGLILAPVFPIRVLHAPIRSFEQYERRVAIALESGHWGERGDAIRARRDRGELHDLYDELALDPDRVTALVSDGVLIEDRTLGEFLAACPDPLAGARRPPGSGAWSAERREQELGQLQRDAMFSISRRFQQVAQQSLTRKRRQVERRRDGSGGSD